MLSQSNRGLFPGGQISDVSHPCEEDIEKSIAQKAQIASSSKARSLRNAVILGFVYLFYFTGFWALTNLQSTMNAEEGMGVDSQAVIYLCSMISCFFPDLLIGKFGTKTICIVALFLSLPYMAANISLRRETIMVSSVLLGLASGPLNTAFTCYIDEMSSRFAAASQETQENSGAIFFGLFMFFNEFSLVAGSIISYYILRKGYHPPPESVSIVAECGVLFNPDEDSGTNNANLDPPPNEIRYIVTGIFLLLSILAVVIAFLLDPLKNDIKEVKGCRSVSSKITSALRQFKNPQQLLLLPLTIFLGLQDSFYSAEYTQAYVACSWGVHRVGFVAICFGVFGCLMAVLVGPMVKCLSQMWVIILSSAVSASACAFLLLWQPSPDTHIMHLVFSGVWGMLDAVWWSQIPALYGLMFPNGREAAYSNLQFWSFLGYFLSYSYAKYLTVTVKIVIMIVILVVGIALYLIGQVRLICNNSRSGYEAIDDSN